MHNVSNSLLQGSFVGACKILSAKLGSYMNGHIFLNNPKMKKNPRNPTKNGFLWPTLFFKDQNVWRKDMKDLKDFTRTAVEGVKWPLWVKIKYIFALDHVPNPYFLDFS